MAGRNTAVIVIGAVAAAVGAFLVWSSMAAVGEYRDADGYYMSDPLPVDRASYAVVSSDVDLLRGRWETLSEGSLVLGIPDAPDDVRVQGTASEPNALFMGIGPTGAVDEYLGGVAHDQITDWNANVATINEVEYTAHQGTALPRPPGSETFWVTSVAGTGQQTLDWTIEPGDWTAVIMNADAAPGVRAELAFGALPTWNMNAVAVTALAVGLISLVGGGLLLFFGLRRSSRDSGSIDASPLQQPSATESQPINENSTTAS